MQNPLLQEAGVIAFHHLEAAVVAGINPAVDVCQAFGHHSPFFHETSVDGSGVLIFEVFDDHELHRYILIDGFDLYGA